MSGQHRKISRSLDSSSGFVTSRSHLTQPENELKQKLNAIDSSIKISNKKINNETRELRQILYDLQRDLKVSKSVSHYVPSPIEEQETKQKKRVRRVTVATAPRDLQLHRAEIIPKSTGKTTAEDAPEVTQGTSTKRRRKTSVPPTIKGKLLVKGDDVYKEWEMAATSSNEKLSGVEESGKESLEHNDKQGTDNEMSWEEEQMIKREERTTDSHCGHSVQDGAQLHIPSSHDPGSGETSQAKPSSLSVDSSLSSDQVDSSNYTDIKTTNVSSGIPNIHAQKQRSSTHENTKGCPSGSVTSYLREGRRRSLSESETAYRETFKGRFVTHSLPSQSDHVRGTLPPPDSQKRTRRITVAGPHPLGARRRLNIGDIPMTPFNSGSRRINANSIYEDEHKKSRPLGRGPTGSGQPLRKGNDEEEIDKSLLATPSRDTPRYRSDVNAAQFGGQNKRTSISRELEPIVLSSKYFELPCTVQQGTNMPTFGFRTSKVSSLPPLKEERTMQKVENQAVPREWKNLENCRYLRKEDYEISIEDIFKKD